jgi:adenylosuccinate synthase
LAPPGTGWDKLPAASDTSTEADLVRVKFYRNNIFAHISETSIDDSDFEKYWSEIESVLVRLGGAGYEAEIQRLRVESIDAGDEAFYIRILEEWEHSEKNLNSAIKEAEENLTEKLDQAQQNLAEKVDEAEQRITDKLDEVKEVFKINVYADGTQTSGKDIAQLKLLL